MSSYLLAFVVSDLGFISNEATRQESDPLHRVWARQDYLHRAQYGLYNSVNILKVLEDYVDVKFNLSKIDSAGVPNKGGAIENWGMIIYRFVWLYKIRKQILYSRLNIKQRKCDGL